MYLVLADSAIFYNMLLVSTIHSWFVIGLDMLLHGPKTGGNNQNMTVFEEEV